MGALQAMAMALASFASSNPATLAISLVALLLVGRSVYRVSPAHALYTVPGPVLPRLTSIWLNYHAFIGDECTAVHELHEKYGPIVRIGPDSVDISDGAVLKTIYLDKGGFTKPEFYRNFDMDGHATIFSSTNPSHRAPRAKAVAPLFSTGSISSGAEHLAMASHGFVRRLQREMTRARGSAGKVDILPIARGFALDSVTSYLMGKEYGANEEDLTLPQGNAAASKSHGEHGSMSASSMVDTFVGVGKNWYLPAWAFQSYENIMGKVLPNPDADQSISCVDDFLVGVLEAAKQEVAHETNERPATSFPARLLKASISDSEVAAQCKDLIFAGTDSTAMNLVTICFMLCKNPDTYASLRREMSETAPADHDLQSLPYLQAVIKEGLRLSMANPSRLPRVVPESGFRYGDCFLGQGMIVSCTPFELHLNGRVFQNPTEFQPRRWLSEGDTSEDMRRDMIPFGRGTRQCIARNLAMAELSKVVSVIATENILGGLTNVEESIDIWQWFNSHVIGHKVELQLRDMA